MKKLKWAEVQGLITDNKGVIFLEFSTTWCGDCQMMRPFVSQVEKEFEGKDVQFIEVDAEEADLLRKEGDFMVGKVPSFYVINKNKVNHVGYEFQPVEKLAKAIASEL